MTADAKVGLLLGLVFIVIIAFLVNGLPSFLQSASAEDVVINTITPPTGPDLVIDDRVMDTARQLQPELRFRQTEPPQDVVLLNPQGVSPAATVEPVMGAAPVQPVQPVEPVQPVAAQPQAQPTAVLSPQVTLVTPAASSSDTTVAIQPATAPKGRIHVIQNGETLSSIAQKYYGKEEGNRRAVIQKLYEANRKVLASQDKVRVGDKLTIPPLTEMVGGTPAAKAPEASQTLLTKFSTMLERPAKEDQKQITEYTVKQGDSLWSIAQRTLGDGKRYKEIIQANQDKIKDADDLTTGMSLKIPK